MVAIVVLCAPALVYGLFHIVDDVAGSGLRTSVIWADAGTFILIGGALSPISSLSALWLLRHKWVGMSRMRRVIGTLLCAAALFWSAYVWLGLSMIGMRA